VGGRGEDISDEWKLDILGSAETFDGPPTSLEVANPFSEISVIQTTFYRNDSVKSYLPSRR
jgi:hypothetical protein